MRFGNYGLAAVRAILLLGLAGIQPARAEPVVTLTSQDGATQVEGELLSFDGKTYALRTSLGIIAVDAAQVLCSGAGCPAGMATDAPAVPVAPALEALVPIAAPAPAAHFAIFGSNIIGDGLLPVLIEGFADSLDAEMIRQVGGGDNDAAYLIAGLDGREIAEISVSAHGTATAFPALASGEAVLGMTSRRMNGSEDGLPDLRDGPGENIIALDGLVVLVNSENPVRALTLDQIAALFAGRITNWSLLGGHDQPVSIYAPSADSGTAAVFEETVMVPRQVAISDSAERLEDHADLSDLVSIDPSGIGLTGFAYARASQMVAIRQQCGLVSAPAAFTIKAEEYPLARRLYIYDTVGDLTGPIQDQVLALRDFALSDAAQPLIAERGFVDRGIQHQGIDAQGERLANSITSQEEFSLPLFREMLTELKGAERLSVTFRFTLGSSNLEARSQSEAERFANLLAAGAYAGKEILLVGFTDSVGEFEVNRSLAVRRAESVLGTLKASVARGALDAVPILVQSYGELTPVGCNEAADGRQLNRRVEVWVRAKSG